MALLDRISIHGFRDARGVELEPRRLCALVGEASGGKSTVLTALWMLLESGAPVPNAEDVTHGRTNGRIRLEASTDTQTFFLDARPPATLNLNREGAPPVVFLPTSRRGSDLVSVATHPRASRAVELIHSATDLSGAVESLVEARVRGLIVLIEEPELYLSPQAQRHVYRLLRSLAERGNQVLYSTHASTFLSVAHLDELALVRQGPASGMALLQPEPLASDESFRALAEFDAERAEMFLSRAVLLVEGLTEKLALPFVFEALGYEPDSEEILILETGGKANMSLFARICNECGIPYVVLHDRDAPRGKQPNESELVTNRAIADVAGRSRIVQLVPDFEGVIGLKPRSRSRRSRKPERAYRRFSGGRPVPEELVEAVERVVAAARGERRRASAAAGASAGGRPGAGGATSGSPRAAQPPRRRARPARDQ